MTQPGRNPPRSPPRLRDSARNLVASLGTMMQALGAAVLGPLASGPYRGAEISRLNKTWQPLSYSGEGAIAQAWDLLTRRIRDLGRNDPAMIALREVLTNNVVRTGIATVAAAQLDGELDDEFNESSDLAFEDWCLDECDAEGRVGFADMQRQLFREMLEPGEALLLECTDPDLGRRVPLCYQVLEAEQIDSSIDRPAAGDKNEIIRGIEVGPLGKPVAYYLFDVHPADPHAYVGPGASTRIPAERVIHLTLPGRPSQTRGVSLYSSIIQSARDLDNYVGSELTSAIIGSLLSVVHKTDQPGSGMGFVGDGSDTSATDSYGNPRVKLGRGIVCQIPKNDDINVVSPQRPNASARTFVDLILMLIGMGGGVSKYRLTRDYSATTYVAGRCARLDDADAFEPMQGYFGRRVCRRVRRRWTQVMAAYGRFVPSLTAMQFRAAPRRWLACELLYPGVDQIDPEKETDSDLAALGAGTTTWQRIYARKGLNYRRELRQRAREETWIRGELGLELNLARPSTPPRRASDDRPADGQQRSRDGQE